ncbi:MAG: ribosome-associated translation inhibitor RaiA [Phycisphaerales bacterium]|nr:ribosome-associated translation inhibitor RaiA [Phycisphaerales bacterium]
MIRQHIIGHGFELTEAIEQHIRQRFETALTSAADQIVDVQVNVSDMNANRGGEDKCCRAMIRLSGLPAVVVEARNRDLYTAVDEVAHRAKSALWRALKRRQTLRREYAERKQRSEVA